MTVVRISGGLILVAAPRGEGLELVAGTEEQGVVWRTTIRGATFILSIVFGIVTIAAPWARDFIQAAVRP